MKLLKRHQIKSAVVITTGLALLIAIYFTTARLFSTYVSIENDRAESFWSIVQLQKELDAMYYQASLYQVGTVGHNALQLQYELLWSRFPVVQNMLEQDEIFKQIEGLASDVKLLFDHVKIVETPIIQDRKLAGAQLSGWIKTLNYDRKRLNGYIIHNMSGFDGDYVTNASKKLLAYLITIAALIISCILYLGFLIHILILQQKRNHFLLAHDSLTGLKSRAYTLRKISKYCQQKQPFTLVNFDLNKFKLINDTFGHHTGDQVLLHVSGLFKKTIAKSGIVGRVGGDEFLWITEETDKGAVKQLHDQLLTQLQRSFMTDDNQIIQLKISTGAGFAADYGFDANCLKDEVDKAMYCAKNTKMQGICWRDSLGDMPDLSVTPAPATPKQNSEPVQRNSHTDIQIHLL